MPSRVGRAAALRAHFVTNAAREHVGCEPTSETLSRLEGLTADLCGWYL
jgi:hypothetical protein